jgi:hypothetical protein
MVINPLVDNLGSLKDSELENKIQDLSKKYWIANSPDIKHQISLFIDMYREELKARQAKLWQEQTQKRNKDLDNLIQVN